MMSLDEVERYVWTVIGEDENRFLGGSFAEAVEHTTRITYAVINHNVRTLADYDRGRT